MELELAIVQNCTPTGCLVQLLNDDFLDVNYSPLVQDRIRIRQQQLVAIDTAVTPPQLMWRWHRVRIHEVTPERMIALIGEVTLVEVVQLEGLEEPVAEGDEFWTAGTNEKMELHAKVIDGKPAYPERLLAHIQPIIDGIYTR